LLDAAPSGDRNGHSIIEGRRWFRASTAAIPYDTDLRELLVVG
jgi:hypothetical protein